MSTIEVPWTLERLLRALHRYKWRSGTFFIAALATALLSIALCERQFGSESLLYVDLGRESIGLDPTATTGQVVALNESRVNELNSAVQMLTSRGTLERIVDTLGAETILAPAPAAPAEPGVQFASVGGDSSGGFSPIQAGMAVLGALGLSDPVDARERAVIKLSRGFTARVPDDSNVISVSCESPDPARSQRIVQLAVENFVADYMAANRTAGSHRFFEEQAGQARSEVLKASEALRDAKNRFGFASIDRRRDHLQDQLNLVEQRFTETSVALSESEAKVSSLEDVSRRVPVERVTATVEGLPNIAADNMREELYRLQIREKELWSRVTDEHPSLITVRSQLAEVEKILAEQEQRRTETTTALNPTHQPLELAMLTEEADLKALQARHASLEREKDQLLAGIQRMNRQEVEIAELQQQLRLAEINFGAYAEKLEQARIDHSLQEQSISSIKVIQPASFVAKPVRPRKILSLALGLFCATTGALGIAVLSEQLSGGLQNVEEVEQLLDVPVLASIPRYRKPPVPVG